MRIKAEQLKNRSKRISPLSKKMLYSVVFCLFLVASIFLMNVSHPDEEEESIIPIEEELTRTNKATPEILEGARSVFYAEQKKVTEELIQEILDERKEAETDILVERKYDSPLERLEKIVSEEESRKSVELEAAMKSKTSVGVDNLEFYSSVKQVENLENISHSLNYSPHKREYPISNFELSKGTVIPSILETAINSDLAGIITARIAEDVWDSKTGRHLLIPKGSQVTGKYVNKLEAGQNRIMVLWDCINFPDSSFLNLPGCPGTDTGGQSGLKDRVNHHYFRIFYNATLMSMICAGVQMSQPEYTEGKGISRAGREFGASLGRNLGQVATDLIQKQMDIPPTIQIREGYRFNIQVNQRLTFVKPYTDE